MDIIGRIKAIFDTQKVSERFSKRDFVLTIDESSPYPQHVTFQLVQDRCALLDSLNVGDEIKVFFNLRGREWKNPEGQIKYFNTLEAWKIEPINASNPSSLPQSQIQKGNSINDYDAPEKPVYDGKGDDFNDLPF